MSVNARLLVVRLDDPKFPAGPATVVAHVASADEYCAYGIDRDGARDGALRLWEDRSGNIAVGARVAMTPVDSKVTR